MDKLTIDTQIFCEQYNYFGCVLGLKEHVEDLDGLHEDNNIVEVVLAREESFCTVNDEFIIDIVQREIERQGCDLERSSESGDEMEKAEQVILKHIKVDYEAIMKEMPTLYYGYGKEFEINLNDY